jgi:hypothetical protein
VSSKNKRERNEREKRESVCVCVLTEVRQAPETDRDRVDSSTTGQSPRRGEHAGE